MNNTNIYSYHISHRGDNGTRNFIFSRMNQIHPVNLQGVPVLQNARDHQGQGHDPVPVHGHVLLPNLAVTTKAAGRRAQNGIPTLVNSNVFLPV